MKFRIITFSHLWAEKQYSNLVAVKYYNLVFYFKPRLRLGLKTKLGYNISRNAGRNYYLSISKIDLFSCSESLVPLVPGNALNTVFKFKIQIKITHLHFVCENFTHSNFTIKSI